MVSPVALVDGRMGGGPSAALDASLAQIAPIEQRVFRKAAARCCADRTLNSIRLLVERVSRFAKLKVEVKSEI
jgi:hypothetical protein